MEEYSPGLQQEPFQLQAVHADTPFHWLETYGALVAATPQKSARRAWPEEACRWASGKRQLIEGVIAQLKDQFGLERHRAKTMSGLLSRLTAKIAAYTCGLTSILGSVDRYAISPTF